jgi:hypothetical protein
MLSDERGASSDQDVFDIDELNETGEEREQAYFLQPGDMVQLKA